MTKKKYKWYKLAEPDEFLVSEGLIIKMTVPEKNFCITQHHGNYYAFQTNCPHAGAKLEHAWISENNCLVCPLHRFKFDITNGRNVSGEGFSLITYPIEVNNNGIWVGLPEQFW